MKLRITYIASLIILVVLVALAMVRPAAAGNNYSEVSREHLIQVDNGYIIKFDIINHEGGDMQYNIRVTLDGYQYNHDITVKDGRIFTYSNTVSRERLGSGDINFAIYKMDEASPFEKITYHLK